VSLLIDLVVWVLPWPHPSLPILALLNTYVVVVLGTALTLSFATGAVTGQPLLPDFGWNATHIASWVGVATDARQPRPADETT